MSSAIIYINLIILLALYFIFNASIVLGWFKLFKSLDSKKLSSKPKSFSILIAMRNEEGTIENVLRDIKNQNYNTKDFEIIVIDDHSTDQSFEFVKNFNIDNLILIKSSGDGKKSAIEAGLKIAKNEYIIQTDSDCGMGENWLLSINNYLNKYSVKLLIAPVVFSPKRKLFATIQELDFFTLIMSTAGLAGIKHSIMANGANLIYPRNIITNSCILKKHTSSGDDVFLLHYIKKEYGRKTIHFIKSKAATVTTESENNINNLLQQRIRWASKSKYYKDIDTIAIGILILIINFIILSLFVASFFCKDFLSIFIIVFITKFIIDFILIIPILSFYKRLELLIYLPILSFVYPFYISFVGIISQFTSFNWKGRKYY